jgi:hypothetical protein
MKKGWEMNGCRGIQSTNGAAPRQPGASPREPYPRLSRGPSARPKCRTAVRAGFQPSIFSYAANLGRCPRLASGRALPLKMGGQR